MAGIYLHIPFCGQACHYCDFHFSTVKKQLPVFHRALVCEMELRYPFFTSPIEISSIYFGGGTPSLLSSEQLSTVLEAISKRWRVAKQAEVTLEANPEDITLDKVKQWKAIGINRLSIGVQSFFDEHLKFFNRIHSAKQALQALEKAKMGGIPNITLDLIYGIPGLTDEQWDQNISQALAMEVPHISSYALTVEEGTALAHFIEKGKVSPLSEEQAERQFNHLRKRLTQNGFVHYEVSNFGKPNYLAVHNSNYWKGEPYLALGPGAHGFLNSTRYWNVSHNVKYLNAMKAGKLAEEKEQLTDYDRLNELVLTGLRTQWGIPKSKLLFSPSLLKGFYLDLDPFLTSGKIEEVEHHYRLARDQWFFADGIAAQLFQLAN